MKSACPRPRVDVGKSRRTPPDLRRQPPRTRIDPLHGVPLAIPHCPPPHPPTPPCSTVLRSAATVRGQLPAGHSARRNRPAAPVRPAALLSPEVSFTRASAIGAPPALRSAPLHAACAAACAAACPAERLGPIRAMK